MGPDAFKVHWSACILALVLVHSALEAGCGRLDPLLAGSTITMEMIKALDYYQRAAELDYYPTS